MKLSDRFKQPRLLRRDWTGDAVLTIVCGVALVAAVFLPWANEDGKGFVNFSLRGATGLRRRAGHALGGAGAAARPGGRWSSGTVMLLFPPRRFSWLLGAFVALLGVAVFFIAQDAAAHIGFLDPGVGMYLTTLVGVLLVPIGLAAALVARFVSRAEREAAPPPPPCSYSPASSRKRSTELIGTPSSSAMRNLADMAFGSPGCRLEWSRIRPRPFSPRICSMA